MKKKLKGLKISLFFIILIIFLLFFLFVSYQKNFGNKVVTSLWLGNHNLKNLTKDEVKKIVDQEIQKNEEKGINFVADNKKITIYPVIIALSDPDLTHRIINLKADETINNIFLWPQKQGFFAFAKAKIESSILNRVELSADIDEKEILKILKSNFKESEKSPQDASLKLENDDWKIIPEQDGIGFNYQKAIDTLKENVANLNIGDIYLEKEVLKPIIYQADLEFSLGDAQRIVNLAPIDLSYGQQKWTIGKKDLENWIVFKKEFGKVTVNLSDEKIKEFLNNLAKDVDQPTQEAKFKMENNKVVEFQLAKEGIKLEIDQSSQKVKSYILSNIKEIQLETITEQPQTLTESVNDLGLKELIARGESNFKGSPKNRIHNIKIGAKTLNGILIKPGEEFSLLKTLGDVSEKNGYLPELVIKGDRTIPELGGGLCQIGTTTFRVALNAGLPITQRAAHAFRVIYYEPAGMDATIYNPSPDFKFINDYSSWLLLQTKIEGTKLIFELYGTTDGRQVELSTPKIYNLVSPGPVKYVETETMKPGTKRLVERATLGADAEFTRTITLPSGEKKEEVWKSHYRPWPEMWLVGKEPMPVSPSKTTDDTPNSATPLTNEPATTPTP